MDDEGLEDAVDVVDGVGLRDAVEVADVDGVNDSDALADDDGLVDAVDVVEGVGLRDAVEVADLDGDAVGDALPDGEGLQDAVDVVEGVGLSDTVDVVEGVALRHTASAETVQFEATPKDRGHTVQPEHSWAPGALLNVPIAQAVHAPAPILSALYAPNGQAVHTWEVVAPTRLP